MNRMYNMKVVEYNNGIMTNIISNGIYDNIEDALESGKKDIYYHIEYELDIPNDQIEKFIINRCNDNHEYNIIIEVFSINRKKFENTKQLMVYFENNINDIANDQLYDFLLSLVDVDARIYDYDGKYLSNNIFGRRDIENISTYNIEFTEESCNNRIYEFWYKS